MPHLRAIYTSPTDTPASQTFTKPLPATSSSPSAQDRVDYLSKLQTSVKDLQDEVNKFLTQKMDEDKARAGDVGKDDAKDEANYGEEVVED